MPRKRKVAGEGVDQTTASTQIQAMTDADYTFTARQGVHGRAQWQYVCTNGSRYENLGLHSTGKDTLHSEAPGISSGTALEHTVTVGYENV